MGEYTKLRKSHEEEKNVMNRNHDDQMTNEKSLLAEARKRIQTLEYEKQKARTHYTEKMREHDKQKNEAQNARLELVKLLADKDNMIRNLKDVVRKLEDGSVNEISLIARQKMIDAQRKEIDQLKDENKKKEMDLKDWEQHCILFWQKDPKNIFRSETKYTKEDKTSFIDKLEKMLRNLRIEVEEGEPMNCGENESSLSTLSDSGVMGRPVHYRGHG